MRKPLPEDFELTAAEYEQAVSQLAHIHAKDKRTKSIITLITFTVSPSVATGVAIVVAKLTIWFLVNEFGMEKGDAIGISFVPGFIAWCFAAAAVSGMFDKLADNRWSKQLSKPVYQKVRLYENALNQYHRRIEGYWKSLRGVQFEKDLARLYSDLGYSVQQTKGSADEGIDLILLKDGKKTIVQCKGHEKPIGIGAIRDLYGTMMHCEADNAVLACPAGFTKAVREFATGKPIRLISATDLVGMAESIDQEK